MQGENSIERLVSFLAVLTLLTALILNIVSLSLPYWLQFDVDRTSFANRTGLDYYSRSRGAFLTCLADTAASPLSSAAYASQVKYGSCFDVDLGNNLNATMAGYLGTGAETIVTLRRLHIGLHLVSGIILAFALIICLFVLVRNGDLSGLVSPTGLSLLAAGLQFGALTSFNNMLMRELLPPIAGTTAASTAALSIYNAWPSDLQAATRVTPGSAYFVALAAFSTCLASAGTGLTGVAMAKQRAAASSKSNSGDFDAPFAPSGSAAKMSNGEQEQMPRYFEQPAARIDTSSSLSVGRQSNRLPRTAVHHSFGAY